MSISKYRFVSPGVFVNEIDNSQLPAATPAIGPVIIGRTERGPAMRPVKVNSFSEYVETFGETVPGGRGGDVWREGNYTSPMYATYAAQAWLRNGQSATVIRLLGAEHVSKTSAGNAGWGSYYTGVDGGGNYGLFLIDSGSGHGDNVNPHTGKQNELQLTGTLAAVWYFPSTHGIQLSGGLRTTTSASAESTIGDKTTGSALFIQSSAGNWGFTAQVVSGSSRTLQKKIDFDFNPDSAKFIRKVFNTNPILTNGDLTDSSNTENYWLAHSFERSINDTLNSSSAGAVHGVILALGEIGSQFDANFSNFKFSAQSANTGWFISQDLRASGANFNPESTTYIKKLFKIHARDGGEWENGNIKISIKDIKASNNQDVDSYGSFTVQVRRAYDTDHAVQVIEEYANCNLNTNSPNYISRMIGDRFSQWDDTTKRLREYGEYPNISRFVRVEVSTAVENGGVEPASLPFGFHGPRRPKAFTIKAGRTGTSASFSTKTFATSSNLVGLQVAQDRLLGKGQVHVGGDAFTGSFIYPRIALRVSSSDAFLSTEKAAYFGYDPRKAGSDLYDPSNNDILRMLPGQASSAASTELSIAFTLDDVKVTGAGAATWVSGSRAAGTSATAVSGAYTQILDDGFDKFTAPMVGGHDGWDVTELDPLANRNFGASAKASYEFNTVRRAIETCADPELVDFNLMVAPGITNDSLTDLMINTCEERADALAIVDIKNVYRGPQEGTSFASFNNRVGILNTIVTDFKNRKKNSSYGATYYPWVQIRDSLSNSTLWVPPSVVALGTYASSDRIGELWFAPAGFNRGGLSQGSSGLSVVNISEKLTSDQRDKLYEVNINPIASFPNEGIVIFGQKTLDASTSALNRINVRRLLIFLKKEISRLSNQVLFDQNLPATWGRFQGLVRPLLESVKIRFGLADYKLVLDETTTTPDLVDRNIMYAKIFLKPARAIEFIALDFIITRTGAAFED